jgi:hypothetical protein
MNFMSFSAALVEGMHTLCHVDMSFRIQMMLSQDFNGFSSQDTEIYASVVCGSTTLNLKMLRYKQ